MEIFPKSDGNLSKHSDERERPVYSAAWSSQDKVVFVVSFSQETDNNF